MIKKIIPLIMAVFMGIPLLAQQSVVLEDVNDAKPGKIIEVPLHLNNFENVGAISLHIAFDGNLLGWSHFTPATPTYNALVNVPENNRLVLHWTDDAGKNIDGKFGTFNFEYQGTFPGTLDFIVGSCEIADEYGGSVGVYTITYTGANVSQDPNLDFDGSATISGASAIAGGNVSVTVSLNDNGGFNGVAKALNLRVGYDSSKLTFVGLGNVQPGFDVEEITAGDDLIITNHNLPDGFVFDGNPLFNLEFQYWGGGNAAVEFLPGSIITNDEGTILVTEFGSGVVEQQVVAEHGSLSIGKIISDAASYQDLDDLPDFPKNDDPNGNQTLVPAEVSLGIIADGLNDNYGLMHLVIAYDKDKLQFTGPMFAQDWTINHGTAGLLILTRTVDIYGNGFNIENGSIFTMTFNYLYVQEDGQESLANVEFQSGTYLQQIDGTPVGPVLINGWVNTGYELDVKVFLEGPYKVAEGKMEPGPNYHQHIPLTQSYTGAPWNYSGDEEVAEVPSDAVDWLYLELREATDPSMATISTRKWKGAFFLRDDGILLSLDGEPMPVINFDEIPDDINNLYLVVYHRNHLGIMSANPMTFSNGVLSFDFTTSAAQVYDGGSGDLTQADLNNNNTVFGMFAGDVASTGQVHPSPSNQSGDVIIADVAYIYAQSAASTIGYVVGDLDMTNQATFANVSKAYDNFSKDARSHIP